MIIIIKYNIVEEKNRLIFRDMYDFNPKHIFECGQAFRWKVEKDGSYTLVAHGRVLNVKKEDKDIVFSNTNLEEFSRIWYNYFDLARDYGAIKKDLSKDPILKDAVEYGQGLRILNQEPYETIVSFIISANNQIPRIKRSIELIAEKYGDEIPYGHESHYSFPTPKKISSLSTEELKEISRVGFRAERIIESSKIIHRKDIDLNSLYEINRDQGKELLMKLPGVGPKVSDCILLFSFNKGDAFPVDTWVKRVMEHFYIKKDTSVKDIGLYGGEKFGNLAGFAQQYLFYYAREERIGK